jgi:formylglycine-generating enzyme required for sulfatase activity
MEHPMVEMIEISGGKFRLGEGPDSHELEIAAFQIGRFPVTTAQYQQYAVESGYPPPAHWPNGQPLMLFADHPVVNVTWFDALAFCDWLSGLQGKACRLPTEAEWELAARGPEGYTYPWGYTYHKENCNTWETGGGYTRPVSAFPQGASPFGVMDMVGNVWEWCSSVFLEYPYVRTDGREDTSDLGAWRTLRGGSWYDTEWGVRAARRLGSPPVYSSDNTGFRVACDR